MNKHWTEYEKEFSDHVIDWFDKKDLDGSDGCRLLFFILCASSVSYGYSQEQFDAAADGLKKMFTSMKKKHEKFNANKP